MSDMQDNSQGNESNVGEEEFINFTFKRSHFTTFIVIVVYALGIVSGYVLRGQESVSLVNSLVDAIPTAAIASVAPTQVSSAQQQSNQQSLAAPQEVRRYDVPLDDDPRFGPADAPITIVEFSDFECPYCTRFHQETLGPLIEKYGDQIQFVYRDLPLVNIHSEAFPAAIAANCAGEQASYWDYHNMLFNGGPSVLGMQTYLTYATQLNLDLDDFQECLDSGRWDAEIQADLDFAINLGVRSTPTFFINGIPLVGAQPLDVFITVIDNELAGAND